MIDFILYDNYYLDKELLTYIGNKRKLISFIDTEVQNIKDTLGKNKLISLDGIAGSGCISRLLKYNSSVLHSNDIELYSYVINKCYLTNKSDIDAKSIKKHISNIENLELIDNGFIYSNYAPKDDKNIQMGERVFYTTRNAKYIDTAKKYIFENTNESERIFLLAPLLIEASIHTNTSGVFKGFHKDGKIGCFGGKGHNALERIMKDIHLYVPHLIDSECEIVMHSKDINVLINDIDDLDLVYYDPPYNQHPYGSNYFMLNLIADEKEHKIQNGVSGIVEDWYKSDYNTKSKAIDALDNLIKNTNSKYILISYNDEGIIPFDVFKKICEKYGEVTLTTNDYNTYRGSRNLNERNIKVKELLWKIKK